MSVSERPDVECRYSLTPAQSAMLFHSLSSPDSGVYIEQVCCELSEPIDVEALQQAWHQVSHRYAALRTRFAYESDVPAQEVLETIVPLTYEDWANTDSAHQEERYESYRDDGLALDLEASGIPMRITLLRLGADRYRMLWVFHHALLDGRSTRIVLRDLFEIYDAMIEGRELQFPTAPQFADYVTWLDQQHTDKSRSYWQEQLSGVTPTPLVMQGDNKNIQGHGVVETRLSNESSELLRRFTQEHGLTMNTLLQGAWALLLGQYNGIEDVSFAATRALRASSFERVRDVVGVLINTVPVRVAIPADTPTLDWLQNLRSQWVEMRPHECVPLADVTRWIEAATEPPLLSSLVTCENSLLNTELACETKVRSFQSSSVTNFPLTVVGFNEPQWTLKISYERARFDRAMIERMLDHLSHTIEEFARFPDLPLKDQNVLTPPERQQLLRRWQATDTDWAHNECVHRLFEERVEESPDATAVTDHGRALGFRELNRRANQIAHALQHRGIGHGDLVGICLPRSADRIMAIIAVHKAGGAYLLLDENDPRLRFEAIVADADLAMIISEGKRVPYLSELGVPAIDVDRDADTIAREDTANPESDVTLASPAYAVFTSGSTGRPKGILIPHLALTNHTFALIDHYQISPADKRLHIAAVGSDVMVAELFPYLVTGGTIVLPPDLNAGSIRSFLRCLDEERITVVGMPSALWHEWVMLMANDNVEFPKSLRIVIAGMDRVRPELFAIWRSKARPGVRWFNAYGPSETTCTTTIYEADMSSDEAFESIPIGRPIANTRAYVLNRYSKPVPIGVAGELCIAGHGLARGYLNDPQLTNEKFGEVELAGELPQRLYRTGDLARFRDDGNLEFLGRLDHQVKIRGHRVELSEIESTLMANALVRDCVVTLREDEGDQRLVAYVVPDSDTTLDAAALRNHLRGRLPQPMVPSTFVMLDALPLTSNGKLDRLALPEPNRECGSDQEDSVPTTPTQERLAAIWREVLKLDHIGIDDDFFMLGGHSLLAFRMVNKIADQFGIQLPMSAVFSASTIESLAELLEDETWLADHATVATDDVTPLVMITPTTDSQSFDALVQILEDSRQVLILPASESEPSLQADLERTAADQLNRLRQHRPNGPYLLCCDSTVGTLALEMAHQLDGQGQIVSGLIALASTPPKCNKRPGLGDRVVRLARRVATLLFAHRDRQRADTLKHKSTEFPIALIQTSPGVDSSAKWRSLAQGRFETYQVGSTERSMSEKSDVGELAEKIEEAINSFECDR